MQTTSMPTTQQLVKESLGSWWYREHGEVIGALGFAQSLAEIPWGKPQGAPDPDWGQLYESRDEAWEAYLAARRDEAPDRAIYAGWSRLRHSIDPGDWEMAVATINRAYRGMGHDGSSEALNDGWQEAAFVWALTRPEAEADETTKQSIERAWAVFQAGYATLGYAGGKLIVYRPTTLDRKDG